MGGGPCSLPKLLYVPMFANVFHQVFVGFYDRHDWPSIVYLRESSSKRILEVEWNSSMRLMLIVAG